MRKRPPVFEKVLERLFATRGLDLEARALDFRMRELGFQTRERLLEVGGVHQRVLALHDEAQELDVEVLELGLGAWPFDDSVPEPHVQLVSERVELANSSSSFALSAQNRADRRDPTWLWRSSRDALAPASLGLRLHSSAPVDACCGGRADREDGGADLARIDGDADNRRSLALLRFRRWNGLP
jgi:hypothetical protein